MATNYDNPSIYVADLKAYNEGKLIGEWVDLTEFDEGYEVMEKISDLMDGYSKKYHNGMETEYAIHDFENFSRELYSESMGEEDFDIILKTHKISEERDIPAEVLQDVMARYDSASKDIEGFINDRYRGQFDTETDFAYDYVDMVGGIENLRTTDIDMYFDYASFGSDYVTNYIDEVDGHYFDNYAKGGKIKTHDLKKYMKRGGGIYPQSDLSIVSQFAFDELITQNFGQNPLYIIGSDVIYPINTKNGVEEIVVERFREYDSPKDVVDRIVKKSRQEKFAKGGKLKSFFSKAKEVGGKAYAKGKEKAKEIAHNTKEAIKESKHNQVVNHTLKALYETRKWDYGATDEEKTHLNRAEHIINEKYLFEPTPYVPTNTELKAKGGDIAFLPTPMMDNFHRNIMGTLSFDMQVKPMRKAQDFIVYPMKTLEEYLHIQSNKKFGYIRLEDGKGILSKGNGNTSWHLRRDMEMRNVIRFELTSSQLEELKFMLKQTSGSKVGSSVIFSDNSGVSMLESGGEIDENKAHYYIEQGTIFVDSNFINMCQNALPNSTLKHFGFGDFYLETPQGNVNFNRTDFRIKDFVGRTHQLGGSQEVGNALLNAMKSKSVEVKADNYAKGGSMKNSILKGGTIFAKGKEGRYHILGVPKSEPMAKPSFHSSVHDHSDIKQAVARARKDFKDLTNKEFEIFVTDDKEDREIYNYAKGGYLEGKTYYIVNYYSSESDIPNGIALKNSSFDTKEDANTFLKSIQNKGGRGFVTDFRKPTQDTISKLDRDIDENYMMAKGGLVNKEFLSNQTSDYSNRILQSIADYYGTTKSKIQRELYDDDAEMIYEYIGNDSGLRRLVYEQMENFKNRNNYKKGGNVKDKVERTDLIVYYPNIDYSMGSPNYIKELECSVYAKEEHHLRGQIDDCLNNIGVYNSQILGYKVIGANPYNYEDDLRAVLRLNEMRGFYDKGESARKLMTGDSATFGAFEKGGYVVEDGKVMLDGKKIGSYQFDRNSNSFWIYDGVKDRSFEEKEDIIEYFKNSNFAKGGMTKSMEVEEVMQDHFAKGGTFPNNFMVSSYDVSYHINYDNGGGSSTSLIWDGYEDYDRNGDLIYDVEDSYNEAIKEYNKISEKMFYEGEVVDYVELTALGEYKDLDDDDLNNFGFTILKSKGTSPFDRKRQGEFAEGGRVVKPHFDATAYEYRHDGMYGDSKKFATEKEAIEWGLKQFQSRKDDVQKVEIHSIKPNNTGGMNYLKVFHIDKNSPMGRRMVNRIFAEGGEIPFDIRGEVYVTFKDGREEFINVDDDRRFATNESEAEQRWMNTLLEDEDIEDVDGSVTATRVSDYEEGGNIKMNEVTRFVSNQTIELRPTESQLTETMKWLSNNNYSNTGKMNERGGSFYIGVSVDESKDKFYKLVEYLNSKSINYGWLSDVELKVGEEVGFDVPYFESFLEYRGKIIADKGTYLRIKYYEPLYDKMNITDVEYDRVYRLSKFAKGGKMAYGGKLTTLSDEDIVLVDTNKWKIIDTFPSITKAKNFGNDWLEEQYDKGNKDAQFGVMKYQGWLKQAKIYFPNNYADGGEIDVRDEGNMAKTYDGRIGKISKVDGLYYTLKFKDGKLPYKLTLHQKDIIFSDSKFFAKGGLLDFDVLVDDTPLVQISKDDFLDTYNVSYFQKENIPKSVLDTLQNRKELTREETIVVLKELRNDKLVKIDVPLPFAKGGSTYAEGGEIDGQTFRSAVIWAKGDIHENFNYEETDLDIQTNLLSDHTELYKASNTFGIRDYDTWREIYEIAFEDMGIENPPQFDNGGSIGKSITYSATFDLVDADGNNIENPMPSLQFDVSSDVSYGKARDLAQSTFENGSFFEEGMKAVMTDFWMGEMDADEEDRKRVEIKEQEEREEFIPKVERSGKWDASYSVLCDELATYEMGGSTDDGKQKVSGTAYYITNKSVDNAYGEKGSGDEYNYENLSQSQLDSKQEFESLLDDEVILEFDFDVFVNYDWQIVQAIYEQMAQEKMYGNNEHIIGFALGFNVSDDFSSSLPYNIDEDEYYEKGGDISDKQYLDNLAEQRNKLTRERRLDRLENIYSKYENYKTPYQKKQFDVFDKKSNELLEKNNSTFFDDLSDSDIAQLERLSDDLDLKDIQGYAQGGDIDSFGKSGYVEVKPRHAHREEVDELLNWLDNNSWEIERFDTYESRGNNELDYIGISTENISREEVEELYNYLEENNWEYSNLYAKGGEIDSFSEYQVFYNDEEMIAVFKDKSSQDAYNVSYFGLLENDELPSVIDEVLNNRRKLSKSESEDLYRKLKGKSGIEIRNVVDGKSTDKRGKKIITPSEFRKILKDLGFKVSFKRNSLGVFAIVKDSEGKELPTIFMGEEHRKKWLPVIELKKQYSIEEDYEKVFFAEGGSIKGRNNKSGESFGVVIGSKQFTDDDKDRISLNVRSNYSSRISERELVFDTNGNLIEILDYGYKLDGSYPNTSSGGSGRHIGASNKKETIDAMVDLGYNKGFANKVIEFVKE